LVGFAYIGGADPLAVQRLLRINVAVAEYWESSFIFRQPWADCDDIAVKTIFQGGLSTTGCGGTETGLAGRQPAEKKIQTWKFVFFFYLANPDHGEGFVPPPLSR
jgi:hypothetical protein